MNAEERKAYNKAVAKALAGKQPHKPFIPHEDNQKTSSNPPANYLNMERKAYNKAVAEALVAKQPHKPFIPHEDNQKTSSNPPANFPNNDIYFLVFVGFILGGFATLVGSTLLIGIAGWFNTFPAFGASIIAPLISGILTFMGSCASAWITVSFADANNRSDGK